jgi:hypothetical protein
MFTEIAQSSRTSILDEEIGTGELRVREGVGAAVCAKTSITRVNRAMILTVRVFITRQVSFQLF